MKRKAAAPVRPGVMLASLLLAALLLLATWASNRPISGPLGEPFTITLHAVSAGTEMHRIDAGAAHPFRIWRSEETDLLLAPEMHGRTFRVLAEECKPAKGSPYYRVIEMIAEDGSFTYTWEDYAAGQAERLPGRMLLVALLSLLAVALIFWITPAFLRP